MQVKVIPRQTEMLDLLESPNDRLAVLYGGAMGGGKSIGIALGALALSLWFPGNRGFIGRLDFKDLRETTYYECIKIWGALGLLDPAHGGQHHKSEHWVRFPNGSETLFGELKDPESRKSLNLGWFAIDEASEVEEDAYDMLWSRLRLVVPGIRYRAILATNPEPGWCKRQFYDEPRPASHYFVRSLPTDNPRLPDGYVESLRDKFSDVWIKRYLEGSWDAFEGAVYTEFDRAVHVQPVLDPPPSWPRCRAIDHGLRNPTCCLWFAVEPVTKIIHVYDEHYRAGVPVSHHVAAILAASGGRPMATVIDPSTAAATTTRNGNPWSIAQEYALNGIPTSPANNAVLAGIGRVKELLKARRLVIHENCVNLLREISEYEWAEGTQARGDPDAPVKKDDHAVDALRYGVVTLVTAELNSTRDQPTQTYQIGPSKPKKSGWSFG